jgi:transcriptional regulator with XRE-family HTH domain
MRHGLRAARLSMGLTQTELGAMIGRTCAMISRLEMGQDNGGEGTWKRLVEVLGVPAEVLWENLPPEYGYAKFLGKTDREAAEAG